MDGGASGVLAVCPQVEGSSSRWAERHTGRVAQRPFTWPCLGVPGQVTPPLWASICFPRLENESDNGSVYLTGGGKDGVD